MPVDLIVVIISQCMCVYPTTALHTLHNFISQLYLHKAETGKIPAFWSSQSGRGNR